jgi:site-specific recombinase XerD
VRLQLMRRTRELALFNLAIDSKLRGCDLVALRVRDVCHGSQVASRAIVMQQKTHLSTRQYARIVTGWIEEVGLERGRYGTHTMRRTQASLIYRRTKNLRAVQLLLGHSKLESTVRYLGVEIDHALELAEQTEL